MVITRPEMADTSEHGRTRTPQAAGPAPVVAVLREPGVQQCIAALVLAAPLAAGTSVVVAGISAVDTPVEEVPEAVVATAAVAAEAVIGKIVRSERSR